MNWLQSIQCFLTTIWLFDIFDNEKFNKLYEERERIFLKGAKELHKKI